MRPEIKAVVKEIQADHESGSRELGLKALRALKEVGPGCNGEELRELCRFLALARPMNASVENAIAGAWSRFLDSGDCVTAAEETIEAIDQAPEEIALAVRKVVPRSATIMTHSYSWTVMDQLARIKPSHVIVTEARPFNDGLKMAKDLVRNGVSTTFITEAQMAVFVHEADAVLVGADTILPEGDFINKIGTRLLALAARDAEVPFYVVAETLKVAGPSEPMPFAPQEGKAKEICDEKWLEVRNVYYEVTPARLLTSYITEQGVLDPADVQRFSLEADKHWQALMNSHEG